MEGTDSYGDGLFRKDENRRQHHCRKELTKMRDLAIKRRITHVDVKTTRNYAENRVKY